MAEQPEQHKQHGGAGRAVVLLQLGSSAQCDHRVAQPIDWVWQAAGGALGVLLGGLGEQLLGESRRVDRSRGAGLPHRATSAGALT